MKKDIYIIKNDFNNKVYIGQAKNSKNRFLTHCRLKENGVYFDKIIHKYGKEHFWFEILESQIDNYNEREQYWIQYYNSQIPNGYNISPGGDQKHDSQKGINCSSSVIKDEKILFNIIDDLRNTSLTIIDISKKYNINKGTISKINTGRAYKLDIFNYPLRPFYQGKKILNEQQEHEIKNLIKNSILTFNEIADKYNIRVGLVVKINCGENYYDPNENYPLRTSHIVSKHLSQEKLDIIYDRLINGTESLREISRRTGADVCQVQKINNGIIKCYRRQNIEYPIRKFNPKKPVSTISAKESTITIDT